VAILPKPACIWRFDERDRKTGALRHEMFVTLRSEDMIAFLLLLGADRGAVFIKETAEGISSAFR
jgi:hypothetical protein